MFLKVIFIIALIPIIAANYELKVPNCAQGNAYTSAFQLSSNAGPPRQPTNVSVCYSNTHLQIFFNSRDNNIHSSYSQCNQPLYNEDVVEMFIVDADTGQYPKYYFELEVSPNSVLFVSQIYNPNGVCQGIVGTLIDCNKSGIQYTAKRFDQQNYWTASLNIPWTFLQKSLIAPNGTITAFSKTWMVNFFSY